MSFLSLPITAWSACTALGVTTQTTLDRLAEGASGLMKPSLALPFDTVCGVVDPALPAVRGVLARFDSRVGRMAMQLLDELSPGVQRAIGRWGAHRVAVVLASSTGGLAETETALRHHRATGVLPSDFNLHTVHSFHAVADLVRARSGLTGPAYVLSTACSSSGKVFGSARRLIAADLADAVLVGGIDSLCETTLHGFHSLGILSARPSRPFSTNREGLNLGEGGAMFLLEREGEARARLLGVGETSDAYHASAPHPEGLGARAAMTAALAQAGLAPEDIDHINAHGTGTPRNDLVEALAIQGIFGCAVPVVSTKPATGHCLGAAGAIEAAFSVAALESGWIPPSLNVDPRDPEIRIHLNTSRRALRCRAVLSNSFGFGGSNVSVVLGAA